LDKKLKGLLFFWVLLILFLSWSVAAAQTLASSNSFERIFDLLKDIWHTVLKFGTLTFLLGDSANQSENLVALTRIIVAAIIGIIIYNLLSLGFANYVSKQIRIALAALFSILGLVFIPPALLIAIAGSYGLFFAFVLLGFFVGGVTWLLVGTATPTRVHALGKLLVLLMVFLTLGLFDDTASGSGGISLTAGVGTQDSLGSYTEWVNILIDWSYLVIVLVGVYLFWKLLGGGDESRVTGSDFAEGFGSLKEKGFVPFTQKYHQRAAKSTFTSALGEVAIEQKWHHIIKTLHDALDGVANEYYNLTITPSSLSPSDAESVFEHFWHKVEGEVLTDVTQSLNEWWKSGSLFSRSGRRLRLTHQRKLKALLDTLQKDPQFVADHGKDLTKLRTYENQIDKNHDETLKRLEEIKKLVSTLNEKAKEAVMAGKGGIGRPTPTPYSGVPGVFNILVAQHKLAEFKSVDMDKAVTLAKQAAELQDDKAHPSFEGGVVYLLTAIMEELRKLGVA